MNRIFKRAKILATLGPATNSYEMIESMLDSGVNGFRLNFSHGTHEERDQQIIWVRQASKKLGKPVAIYQDLQGPKVRLGNLKDDMQIEVHTGDILELEYDIEHNGGLHLPVQYDLSAAVKPGHVIFIFDGKVRSVVESVEGAVVRVRVENDGILMSRKGLNLPDTDFSGSVLTDKDFRDIDYGAHQDIDFVGLSFVHRASDVEMLRGYLAEKGSRALVMAKVETKTAIEPDELERIIEASDAVMVARGDLASEVGPEVVPSVQRQIIALCQKHSKISIVATQVLGSMVDSPQASRAEISDVANAVITGADCIMLSDETATGSFPLEAIRVMKSTILYTQENVDSQPLAIPIVPGTNASAICKAAIAVAIEANAEAIIAETKSGATAVAIAAHRPNMPIMSVTSDERVANQLCLLYATKSFLRPDGERAGYDLAKELVEQGMLSEGATVVLVSGRQPGIMGGTDTIRVRTLGARA